MDCNKTKIFIEELDRMCKYYSFPQNNEGAGRCKKCPIGVANNGSDVLCDRFPVKYPQEAIEIVQAWSDENPIKTRLSMFLEMFPNAEIADDGMPYIYPCKLDANYEFSEDCKAFLGGFRCGMCKKEYWLSEVE